MKKQSILRNNKTVFFALLLSLSLGLAPFSPEPHIIGKVRWILGGAHGMQVMDYFDLLLHGFPWVLLFIAVVKKIKSPSR